jgi:hypothetical protein
VFPVEFIAQALGFTQHPIDAAVEDRRDRRFDPASGVARIGLSVAQGGHASDRLERVLGVSGLRTAFSRAPLWRRSGFGRIKDWRRVHSRYDRCAHTYFSAICIAATVIFWL